MSFQFSPITDDQINALNNRGLLSKGTYRFKVKGGEYLTSKSGNFMLKLKLGVTDKDGYEHIIFDNLMTMESMMFKTKHFCDSIGLEKKYISGSFTVEDCIGLTGQCKVDIKKGNVKPDGSGFYPDSNVIRDYVKLSSLESKSDTDPFNDDIKF